MNGIVQLTEGSLPLANAAVETRSASSHHQFDLMEKLEQQDICVCRPQMESILTRVDAIELEFVVDVNLLLFGVCRSIDS
jgi:hypothetical protein